MEIFNSISDLIKIALVFCFILFLLRKKVGLGNTFILGAVGVGALFGLPPLKISSSFLSSMLLPRTISLACIVSLILVLSSSMENVGQMKRMLDKFKGLISNQKLNLVIFPSLIGLLPMPGGAVFSAPMVKEMASGADFSGRDLSFINYWFRHIWEYWWPMYPGVLLAAAVSDISLPVFMVATFPLTFLVIYFGRNTVNGFKRNTLAGNDKNIRPDLKPFLKELLPIIIVIIPGLSLGALFSYLKPGIPVLKDVGLIISLCFAIVWVWIINKVSATQIRKILFNISQIKMIYMIIGILVFKGILHDSSAVKFVSEELTAFQIPVVLIVIILPLIVGLLTGITIAFVGSAFPIIIQLIHSTGNSDLMVAFMMLGLVSGFVGVLLSPVHLCLILSNEYFKTTLNDVCRVLIKPCFFLLISAIVYFYMLCFIIPYVNRF